jgi:hypothetical protein
MAEVGVSMLVVRWVVSDEGAVMKTAKQALMPILMEA